MHSTNCWSLGNNIDKDTNTIKAEVLGHNRANRQNFNVGVGNVFKNDLCRLLDGHAHHLGP
jgi:hypothetical protein